MTKTVASPMNSHDVMRIDGPLSCAAHLSYSGVPSGGLDTVGLDMLALTWAVEMTNLIIEGS